MKQSERREYLIEYLLKENNGYQDIAMPQDEEAQRKLLRALLNVRRAKEISSEFLAVQDAYLKQRAVEKGIVDMAQLKVVSEGIYLWRGDITRLKVDAIVNAANSQMTGCYYPNHGCIDNCIHTYSGVQLRLACAEIMKKQGHNEKCGQAKITPAFNLPSRFVIHTVGPIIYGEVSGKDRKDLAACYRSCLKLAVQNNCQNIAFCCISTGEYHFPNEEAAKIAIETVREYQKEKSIEVIFNVFKESDEAIYRRLLQEA